MENINIGKENLSEVFDKIDKESQKSQKKNHIKSFNNISKINKVSKKCKILNIELISSLFEPKGLILKIGPFGWDKSVRKEKDGITYFGYEELEDKQNVFNYIL